MGGLKWYATIEIQVNGLWGVINAALDGLWVALSQGKIVRRTAFFYMIYLTHISYTFCFEAAEASGWDPITIAACFAILTPVSALQGAALKFYNDQRRLDQNATPNDTHSDTHRDNVGS